MTQLLTLPNAGSYARQSLRRRLQFHLHPKKGLIDQSTDKRRVELQNGEFPALRNVNGVLGWDFVGQISASIHVLDDEGLIEDVVAGKPRTVFIRMSGANATSMCWGRGDRPADAYMWWRGGDQELQWRGTNSWTEFTLPGNKFTDALPLFHETEWNGSAYLNRVSLSDNQLTEVSFGGDPRERFAFNVYGRDCRTSAAWDNTTTLHELAVWNRVLTPAEKRVLAEDPDALIDRTPLYIPRPAAQPTTPKIISVPRAEKPRTGEQLKRGLVYANESMWDRDPNVYTDRAHGDATVNLIRQSTQVEQSRFCSDIGGEHALIQWQPGRRFPGHTWSLFQWCKYPPRSNFEYFWQVENNDVFSRNFSWQGYADGRFFYNGDIIDPGDEKHLWVPFLVRQQGTTWDLRFGSSYFSGTIAEAPTWDCQQFRYGRATSRGTWQMSQTYLWNRWIEDTEQEELWNTTRYDSLFDRRPLYVPIPSGAPGDVELETTITDADLVDPTLTFVQSVETTITDADAVSANLTVESVGDIELGTAMSDVDGMSVDLDIIVWLDTTITDADTMTADLLFDAPGVVELDAVVADSEILQANLILEVSGVVQLDSFPVDADTISADLTVPPLPPVELDVTVADADVVLSNLVVLQPGVINLTAFPQDVDSIDATLVVDFEASVNLADSDSILAALTFETDVGQGAVYFKAEAIIPIYRGEN